MLAAVLDTCVVYSGLRRDFLLSLAAVGVFRVVLTEDILFEINYVEARKLVLGGDDTETARGKADHLTDELRSAFDVEDDSRILLIKPVGLPDPNDEHLVAAAVAGGAEVIVTDNVSDLPAALLPDGVRTQDPRSFLHDMVTANPRVAFCAPWRTCRFGADDRRSLRGRSLTSCMPESLPTSTRSLCSGVPSRRSRPAMMGLDDQQLRLRSR